LDAVAAAAGCSAAYVHKLEQDGVRTPSPRVLAGLCAALGLEYASVMRAAGYEPGADGPEADAALTPKRFSNAHIVVLLEDLQREVRELRTLVERRGVPG
jgi:transcriptional regulator with XRE-family HTH domain